MIFAQKLLAPGPGTKLKATVRWRPFQSALSGSLFFIPPPLVEVMIGEFWLIPIRGKEALNPGFDSGGHPKSCRSRGYLHE
jgi:hypothetical protein